MPTLLTHASPIGRAAGHARPMQQAVRVAESRGWRTVQVPTEPEGLSEALAPHALRGPLPLVGYWSGDPEYLVELERLVAARGATLLQGADTGRELMEIDRWYPRLSALTMRSWMIDEHVPDGLPFPLFIKRLVKSDKEGGIDACRVEDEASLRARLDGGTWCTREWVDLVSDGLTELGMPRAREWRVTLVAGVVVGVEYYWGGRDPWGGLRAEERTVVVDLAQAASRLLPGLLHTVDVAERAEGGWVVVEVGDSQYSTLAHVSPHAWFAAVEPLVIQ